MSSMQSPPKQALLVIGMHRSGTSALTGVLHLLGIPLGSELLGAASDNEGGFWENQRVVDLHEQMLQFLGSSWDDPRELPKDWVERLKNAGFAKKLTDLIDLEFGNQPIWGVKDPRLGRLLPLWLHVLDELGITPKLVFAVRHPGEVCASLLRRNGISPATATLLWLRHLWEPISASQGIKRCLVTYNNLLQDWQSCVGHIATELDIFWPSSVADVERAITEHLRFDLKHQHVAAARDLLPAEWRNGLDRLYAVIEMGVWADFTDELSRIASKFQYFAPVVADIVPPSLMEKQESALRGAESARDTYKAEAARLFEEKKILMETHETHLSQMQEALDAERAHMRLELQESLAECAHIRLELQESLAEAARLAQELQESRAGLATVEAELTHVRGDAAKAIVWKSKLDVAHHELELIKSSRSWRMSKPLRFVARTARYKSLTSEDRKRLARIFAWRNRRSTGTVAAAEGAELYIDRSRETFPLPGVPLAEAMVGKRDFFFWAVIDWHFRMQRPQHLARELARLGHRVFYISNNFVDSASPGFEVEALDDERRLFQIKLHVDGAPSVYSTVPTHDALRQLQASIGLLLAWTKSQACASLVQHPFWLEAARLLPNVAVTYDCMDHHGGFADNSPEILAREAELMRSADLLVVTSEWLYQEAKKCNDNPVMVRNACQFEHFVNSPKEPFRDRLGRKVIGYYGAIAEWFDLDLLEKVALAFPENLILLIGADTAGASQRLGHLSNVEFLGEKPYAELPFYLHGFDVCLLPFKVLPLTLATNPVKVYEYLSAGKEVVSIDLPEMRQFDGLVRTASDHEGFLRAVRAALGSEDVPEVRRSREVFASGQTWRHRALDLAKAVVDLAVPLVSVVVVTYNNLELTKACLTSLERFTMYPSLEVIVVDNASSDGTPAYLAAWASSAEGRKIILNNDNKGFAAANNQGLAMASGEYLVLLNNDTYVTPGWIATLISHLRLNPTVGLIGPVTNNIGNEARIEISYDGMAEMVSAAQRYTARHAGQLTPLRTAAFFCVMMPRRVYDAVGPLDEAFGIGFFEDDDYCRRVEQSGWSIACADDVFVHHHLSASFNKLKQERRQALFEQNKAIYEKKWGPWIPHIYRDR